MGDINLLGMIRKIKNSLSGFVSTSDKASKSAFGIVKVGDNISVSSGKISVPVATAETYGVVLASSGGGGVELTEVWNGTGTVGYTFPEGKTIDDYTFLVIVGGDSDVVRMTEIVPIAIIPDSGNIMVHMFYYDASVAVLKMTVGKTTITRYAGSSQGLNPKKLYVF